MVFPGKLSTSCHVCRRRKVKCDGARPGCSRCAKHGVECSGYPEKFSFREYKPLQKNETAACALSQRPDNYVPRIRSRSPDSSQELSLNTNEIPSRGLSECLDWQSLCNFMNRIVIKVHRSPCSGHLAFMPDLFREKGGAPHLKHAILSVSHLTIFNDTGDHEFYLRARKNHGLALGHLNKALGSHENAVKDETLAACLLMSMFYNFAHEGEGLPDPHMTGICNLLQLRGNEQSKSMYTRSLMAWVIIQVQSQAIGTNKFEYVKLPRLIEDIPKPDCVLGAGILNCRISQFCQLGSDMHNPHAYSSNEINSRQQKSLRKVLTLALYIIEEIEIWNASIPPHWKIQYQFESIGRAAAPTISPHDPWTLTFLATTQSAQLVFCAHVLSCCQQTREQNPEFKLFNFPGGLVGFERNVTDRAAHLLKTISYAVSTAIGSLDTDGDFHPAPAFRFANNNSLIWPIWIVLTCPFACKDQIALCRRSLEFIGQNTGHKLALFLSEKTSVHI